MPRAFQMFLPDGRWIDLDKIREVKPPVQSGTEEYEEDNDDDDTVRRVVLTVVLDGDRVATQYTWFKRTLVSVHDEVYVPLMKAWSNVDVPLKGDANGS